MTAKLVLDIDASEALATLDKIESRAKNITVNAKGGVTSQSAANDEKRLFKEKEKYLKQYQKDYEKLLKFKDWWRRQEIKEEEKAAKEYKRILKQQEKDHKQLLKQREKDLKQHQKEYEKLLKDRDKTISKAHNDALKYEKDAHKQALKYVKDAQKEERRLYKEHIREKERLDKEETRNKKRALKEQRRDEREYQQKWDRRIGRNASLGGQNILGGALQGGLSRMGGIFPDSSLGLITRNAITGSFIGGGIGGGISKGISGLGGMAGRAVAGMGSLGSMAGPLGAGVSMLGTAGGWAAQLAMMSKGAAIAGTGTIMYEGFSRAIGLFSSVVKTFAGAVSALVSKGLRYGMGAAAAGVAGVAGLTVAGVKSYTEKMSGEAGLSVVAGNSANRIRRWAAGYSERPESLHRYSSMIEAATKASSFGMSPELIQKFMPMMMRAGVVMGEPDIAFGMRALQRAATQSEPEAAERFGLNLYEKNLTQMFGNRYNLKNPTEKANAVYAAAEIQLSKFKKGEQIYRNTPGGAFQFLGNKWEQLKENIGQGFSEGYQLVPRLNSYGRFLGAPGTRRGAQGLFQGIGKMAGKGTDWLMGMIPKAIRGAKEFISSDNEGTKASQWGDSFKNFISGAIAGVKTLVALLRTVWSMLAAKGGIFDQAKAKWDEFMASITGKGFGDLFDMFVNKLSSIADTIQLTLENAIAKGIQGGLTLAVQGIPGSLKNLVIGIGNAFTGGTNDPRSVGTPKGLPAFPMFANGGVVPGIEGKPQVAVVHGGEMILNKRQQQSFIPHYASGTVGSNLWPYGPEEYFKYNPRGSSKSAITDKLGDGSAQTLSGQAIQKAGEMAKPYVMDAYGVGKDWWGRAKSLYKHYRGGGGASIYGGFGDLSKYGDRGKTRNFMDMFSGGIDRYGASIRTSNPMLSMNQQMNTYASISADTQSRFSAAIENRNSYNAEASAAFEENFGWLRNRNGGSGTIQRGRNTRRNVTVHGNMYIRGDANDRMRTAEALG